MVVTARGLIYRVLPRAHPTVPGKDLGSRGGHPLGETAVGAQRRPLGSRVRRGPEWACPSDLTTLSAPLPSRAVSPAGGATAGPRAHGSCKRSALTSSNPTKWRRRTNSKEITDGEG